MLSVMLVVVENETNGPSSSLERNCISLSLLAQGEGMNPSILPVAKGKYETVFFNFGKVASLERSKTLISNQFDIKFQIF